MSLGTMCTVGMCFMLAERDGVAQGKKHIVAAVAGCRKPLVSNGWASFAQMGLENATTTLYRLHF